ncbi:hypothetical protein DH2020_005721 [Rehmannia glutinosa]|uniref:GRF-type domain-containing protein n=1 Tax=Rehmannia glutinosa TaxID=99300 RepID=A0ABR0XGV7_REHGL
MEGLWSDHFPAAEKTPPKISPCKMKGRWSEIFPAAEKPAEPAHPPYQRCLICPTCNASCRLLTSKTDQNPGRKFYKCPAFDVSPLNSFHNFFKWADVVKPDEFIDVPYCGGCMAGVCRVRKEKSGPNAGRVLFMCRVKEGEGSCGYRVWQDELQTSAIGRADENITSSQSPTVNNDYTRPANTYLVKENGKSNGRADNESPVINTSEHLHCPGVTSRKMDQVKCQENQRNEFSRRAHGISDERITSFQSPTVNGDHTEPANTDLVKENKQINGRADNESHVINTSEHLECLGVTSRKTDQVKCPENQRNEFSRRAHGISDERITSFQSPIVNGDHTEPVNAVLVEENKQRNEMADNEVGGEGLLFIRCLFDDTCIKTTHLLHFLSFKLHFCGARQYPGTKNFRAALDVSSCSDPFTETSIQNAMSKSISNAFSLAAEHLQNDFLALLEKTDVKDHETMSRRRGNAFAALDRLLFDNQDFKTREEYIHCATSLAEIERSMPGNESYQKLVDRCSSERTRLDEINSVHAKAVDSMTNNKKRLKVLQEEISSTMDWLFQIEAELSCCEVEMRNMENELDQISKNKGVLEEKYLTAANELEKLKTLCEQKEAERDAAKAAFERARELLRG